MRPTYLHTSKQLAQCVIAHILRGCVNYRILTTVRHGSSFHRIFPKLYVCTSIDAETIDSSPSWLESQTSIRQPTLKLFGSSPSRLKSQTSVRRLALKLFGSSPSRLSFDRCRNFWLTPQPSIRRPLQPLTTHALDVCPPTITETKMLPFVCTTQD